MSDAKKCDRCGEYYTMGVNNDIRPSCNGVRIFGVRYISSKQNLDAVDLCPKCTAKVWKYISEYDEEEDSAPNKETIIMTDEEYDKMMEGALCEECTDAYADNETGYDKGVDVKPYKKRVVSFEVVNKCSGNISHLKEMYGVGMRSRNINITYWPNFDTYLMVALVGSNNVEHQMVRGDVDYETLSVELLRFFEYLDMAYDSFGNWLTDTKECDDE